jgi:hypothetical protein
MANPNNIYFQQYPFSFQPAQSPIIVSVGLTGSLAYTASEFQYTAKLWVWDGDYSNSGSYIYEARKYPNSVGAGIFDFSKMINSTLTDLVSNTNFSSLQPVKFYKIGFGWQYASGSTYYTGSSSELAYLTGSDGGSPGRLMAYDGYNVWNDGTLPTRTIDGTNFFPQPWKNTFVNQGIGYTAYFSFPFMTNYVNVTQSVLQTDRSRVIGITSAQNKKGLTICTDPEQYAYSVKGAANVSNFTSSFTASVSITGSYLNGTKASGSYNYIVPYPMTNTISSSFHVPCAPGDGDWATYWPTVSTSSLNTYQFNVSVPGVTGSFNSLPMNYQIVCESYYTPIRIVYKNMYGCFDFINFYKRSNTAMQTEQRVYQQQQGDWGDGTTLSVNSLQTKTQRYIVDANQTLDVNSDWLEEGYNGLMKELLVSDEIYWIENGGLGSTSVATYPLTIKTNSIAFKTGVNNKLIQYTFSFDMGQPYKFII